jgi:alpha-glucosidase (family GH31 glycosyl hydrolase)
MNEPSVFDGPEGTMAKDARHSLDNGRNVESRVVKNAYGFRMMKATYEGMVRRSSQRPFILSRSAFFGS